MYNELDLLRHIERVAEDINKKMSVHGNYALKRYPLTFAIVALFGVVAVSEGIKGLLEEIQILKDNPSYSLAIGLIILIVLGSVYKKLNK